MEPCCGVSGRFWNLRGTLDARLRPHQNMRRHSAGKSGQLLNQVGIHFEIFLHLIHWSSCDRLFTRTRFFVILFLFILLHREKWIPIVCHAYKNISLFLKESQFYKIPFWCKQNYVVSKDKQTLWAFFSWPTGIISIVQHKKSILITHQHCAMLRRNLPVNVLTAEKWNELVLQLKSNTYFRKEKCWKNSSIF